MSGILGSPSFVGSAADIFIEHWASLFIMALLIYSVICVIRYGIVDHRNHTACHPHIPFFQKCKNHNRFFCWACIDLTVGFPLEHLLWLYAPVFRFITMTLGIG